MKPYSMWLLIMLIVGGCARPAPVKTLSAPSPELQAMVQQARDNFGIVERLRVQESYPNDFQEAQNELTSAEEYMRESRYDQALLSARKSLAASQWILRQFYRETIVQSAQEAKTRIDTLTNEDPGNPLQEFLPQLTEILDYSETIEQGQAEIDVTKVLAYLERVSQIKLLAQKTMKLTLKSDVSFDPGQYELSEEGQRILETYCETILAGKKEFDTLHPDRIVSIEINVVGYTDQIDFRERTNIAQKLMEGIEKDLPQKQPARRQFLNRRLSEFRARTVSEYIAQCIRENLSVSIKQENIGVG